MCGLSENIYDYHFVSQGKTTIPSMDDGEEMAATDVRLQQFEKDEGVKDETNTPHRTERERNKTCTDSLHERCDPYCIFRFGKVLTHLRLPFIYTIKKTELKKLKSLCLIIMNWSECALVFTFYKFSNVA